MSDLKQCPPDINLVKTQPDIERRYTNEALRALARCISEVKLPSPTGHGGEFLSTDGTTFFWATAGGGGSSVQSPGCVFSNGNLLLTGTLTSEIRIPYGGTITAWTIAGDAAGDASIVVSHSTYAAYDTMTTLFTATCTGSNKAQATGLSHTLAAGDILRFSGSGFSLFTRCSITLEVI